MGVRRVAPSRGLAARCFSRGATECRTPGAALARLTRFARRRRPAASLPHCSCKVPGGINGIVPIALRVIAIGFRPPQCLVFVYAVRHGPKLSDRSPDFQLLGMLMCRSAQGLVGAL